MRRKRSPILISGKPKPKRLAILIGPKETVRIERDGVVSEVTNGADHDIRLYFAREPR